jgi:hypothetical protein
MLHFEKVAPCLLHLKKHSSTCAINHLLLRGWQNRGGDKQATEEFIKNVETVMKAQYFGNAFYPSNWIFPVQDDGSLGEIKLAN